MSTLQKEVKTSKVRLLFAKSGPMVDTIREMMRNVQITKDLVGKVFVVKKNWDVEIMSCAELLEMRKTNSIYTWHNIGFNDVNHMSEEERKVQLVKMNASVSTKKIKEAIMFNEQVSGKSRIKIIQALEEGDVFKHDRVLLMYLGAVFGAMTVIVASVDEVSIIMQSLYEIED